MSHMKLGCSLCVANRARQDGHRVQTHETVSHSVISFDFFYCPRMKDESDKLTVLVVSDRDTGLCLALPTQQKGGKSLTYLTTELCRFIVHCGHTEVALRCDSEPSTLSLLDSVKRACAGMRIVVHSEPSPTGDHQSNRAAEAMVGVLRQKANLLTCWLVRLKKRQVAVEQFSVVSILFTVGHLFTAHGFTITLQ